MASLQVLRSECCATVGVAWGSPCEPCAATKLECPRGTAKTDGKSCLDVNECMLDADICEGIYSAF